MDQSQNNLDHGFGNFLAGFASQGILNKDITVWLDGARPAKTRIPSSFLGNAVLQPNGMTTTKNTFASIKSKHLKWYIGVLCNVETNTI